MVWEDDVGVYNVSVGWEEGVSESVWWEYAVEGWGGTMAWECVM